MGAASPPAAYDLVPFGHLLLYGALEVGEGLAVASGEVLGALHAPRLPAGRLVADEVGGVDLLGCVEVSPLVVHLLKFPACHGLVLFRHRATPFASLGVCSRTLPLGWEAKTKGSKGLRQESELVPRLARWHSAGRGHGTSPGP